MTLLGVLNTPIAEAYSQNGAAASWAIPTGAVITGKYTKTIVAKNGDVDLCDLEAEMNATGVQTKIISKLVNFNYVPSTGKWTCTSTAPAEVKPKACS